MSKIREEPVVFVMSILAGAQALLGGAGLADVIGARYVLAGVLLVGGIQAGLQFWVRNRVAPMEKVVALVGDQGVVVAGPAQPDVPDGQPVVVQPVSPAVV